MQISLSGKTAVVTGAASGVGLATVHQFVESGIEHLIAVDYAPELPGSLKNLLESSPDRVQFLCGDVKERSTHEKYAELAARKFGGVDVLVNNAGVVTGVTVTDPGAGYVIPPDVTFSNTMGATGAVFFLISSSVG